MDGALLPLNNCAQVLGAAFWTRKCQYIINMLAICDGKALIYYYVVGWSRSEHDNRISKKFRLNLKSPKFSVENQYLPTDSAYPTETRIIPAFRAKPNSGLASAERRFDQLLSVPRVKSDHCIGLLKG